MGNFNVFLLFLSFIAVNLPAGGDAYLYCPKGFELHGKRCYIALNMYASWAEAKEYCAVIGGKLAAIASNEEQMIISGIMTKMIGILSHHVYWLDGSDMLVEREWRWMGDHGASVPIQYSNWGPGMPDPTKERCLEIRYDWLAKWNNHHCWYLNSVMCEAKAFATDGEIIDDTLQDP
ncbi:hypothetical protein ACJMK2_001109 [Sinanodonta woodiana]|uniref:C-type lectin domain-containing protein n=1 Tax=Sinanodonta woodiana TaxID=1069815 RepID=A0ABD3XR84_SINWO